ncbi:hypothetical protein B9Z55_009054 [Caenorhabditis nigoni]|uniref:RING-type domain-containing protein n=1 Tax=Caenorhabditis nigoni TaxID=1611254 RepID=A0A2G5UQN3_9PELO|nr:hypothetical protein B9Z55_009054 [Caenorhabditis nigoni]
MANKEKFDAFLLIIREFKNVLARIWEDDYSQLERLIWNCLESNHPNNVDDLDFIFTRSQFMFAYVSNVIHSNRDLFFPYDRVKNPNHPIAVRVFQDNENQFMMKSELLNALNLVDPNIKKYEDSDGKLVTLKYESISKEFGDLIERIDFLIVPIQRTKHAAVPILTPSGDHCILAADALFEILNRLIFCHRIFKMFQESSWPILSAHLAQLAELFSSHEKSPFFVTIEKVESIEKSIVNSLKSYKKMSTISLLNVRKNGFTVDNLNSVLEYDLGWSYLFPEIQDYAEDVYSEVFKAKKEQFLRTCDLFKAVEKCLLHCFFARFPNLQLFLHTQHACHRLPYLQCYRCSAVPQSTKFQDSTWNDFSYSGYSYSYLTDVEIMILPDGHNSYLQSNILQLGTEIPPECRYFLLDNSDQYELKETEELNEKLVVNLDTFQKFHTTKKIYVRAIPTGKDRRDETRRVFAEEVLDLIPVVVRQQNTPIEENDDRLNKYRENWRLERHPLKTISWTEFWYILEEFDVDKSRITIVPDPDYENSAYKMMKDLKEGSLKIRGPYGRWVIQKEHAVFELFVSLICEMDRCTLKGVNHMQFMKALRINVLTESRRFLECDEGEYIEWERVEDMISRYRNLFKSLCPTEFSPLRRLKVMKIDELVLMDEFLSEMSKHKFDNYLRENKEMMHRNEFESVWKCYEWYLNACLDDFKTLREDTSDVMRVIREVISFKIPEDKKFLEAMRPKEFPLGDCHCSCPENREDEVEEKKKKKGVKEKAEVKIAPGAPEEIQKTSPIEKLAAVDKNQSKNCSKCLRTSEMCNEAKKELKLTQNKLEKYEKKAKRTEEVEKELKTLKLEMKNREKEAERRESEMSKKEKENEELKMKVSKLEASESRMRLNEKNHSISQNELLEKITHLSDQLRIEKERNDVLQSEKIDELTAQLESQKEIVELMKLQIHQNEKDFNNDIRQKERGIEELRAALNIMSNEKESIQRENRNLRERIASIPEAPPIPTVRGSPLEGSTHHRFALLGFQKIKDSLYHKKQLKQAKEMVEKLKSCTNLVEIHQIADYEYYQFEWNLLKYTKEVELNIQRIKETCDVSMVTPLPDIPEFSHRFMNLYWRIINNQQIAPSEIEVSDSECFICTEEMASDQKTLQCEECKKVTHFECASKWLKIHRSCPHCRREMLDPEEFPNLGQ